MNKLLIIADNAEEYLSCIQEQDLPELDISIAQTPEQAQPFSNEANIILGKPDLVTPLLNRAPNLKWVQSAFAGIDPFCSPDLRTDYTLTGVKDIFGPLMSEYVFTYILTLERNIFSVRENQIRKNWVSIPYRGLAGVSIGICGLGSIGREIAKTASHFRMRVLGLSRSTSEVPCVERVFHTSEICDLAKQVDYLVVVLPNTAETRSIINEEVFEALSPTSVLINVGRGAGVDEKALINAVCSGGIRSAVLDVFCEEPLPKDSPLWNLDNVFITPHNAAYTFPKDIAEIFCENYRRFIDGKPLKFVIDFDRGY